MDTRRPDLLYGLHAIAGHLGMTPRQAKHRALTKLIPTFKIERTVCARRSSLDAWIAEQEVKAQGSMADETASKAIETAQHGTLPIKKRKLQPRTNAVRSYG